MRRFPSTFCSASLATKSEFSSSAINIDIHLSGPGVDRSWKSVAWSGLAFQSGNQGVGVKILNLSKRFGKMSKRWLCFADELTTACKSNRIVVAHVIEREKVRLETAFPVSNVSYSTTIT